MDTIYSQLADADNIIYTILGEDAGLNKGQLLDKAKEMAQHYHEKWNGSGVED